MGKGNKKASTTEKVVLATSIISLIIEIIEFIEKLLD